MSSGGIWPHRFPLNAFDNASAAGIGSKGPSPSAFGPRNGLLGPGARELLGILDNSHLRREFSEWEKVEVWIKGSEVPGLSLSHWRYDVFGSIIAWHEYGNPNSPYGWEIDHIRALAIGGTNELINLRPLHCKTNRSLGGLLGCALK